jgi:hypothetical protein
MLAFIFYLSNPTFSYATTIILFEDRPVQAQTTFSSFYNLHLTKNGFDP